MKTTIQYISVLALLLLSYACKTKSEPFPIAKDQKMIDFPIELQDKRIIDSKDLPAKPMLVFRFELFCPYSRAQLSEILSHINTMEQVSIVILVSQSFDSMKETITKYELNKYKNITIGFDTLNKFLPSFNVGAVPFLAFYQKDKTIKKAFNMRLDYETIQEQCKALGT